MDVRRGQEPAVEVVRPGMVRTLERPAEVRARWVVVEELRAPMRAQVVERPKLAVPVAHDEHRLAHDVADEVVARAGDLVRAADAHPAAEEESLALLVGHGRAGVVGAGEGGAGAPVLLGGRPWTLLGDHGCGRRAADQRVRGKPRSTFEVPGSGQREVTTLPRV